MYPASKVPGSFTPLFKGTMNFIICYFTIRHHGSFMNIWNTYLCLLFDIKCSVFVTQVDMQDMCYDIRIYSCQQSICIEFNWMQAFYKIYIMSDDDLVTLGANQDNKVHGANMGPTWVLSAPDGPHVGPMNLAIWESMFRYYPNFPSPSINWNWICRSGGYYLGN